MVGDKFETDILMAANAQIDSTLVLTGETKLEQVEISLSDPLFHSYQQKNNLYICHDLL